MKPMLLIALKDLKLRFRDRSVFIIGLIAPALLALIFTFAFGDALDPDGGGFSTSYGYVDLDNGDAGDVLGSILSELDQSDQFTVVDYGSVEQATAAIDDGDVASVFVLPEGFSDAVGTSDVSIEVIGQVDAPTSTAIATAIADAYAMNVERVSLTVAATLEAGADPAEIPAVIDAAVTQPPLASLGDLTTAVRQMDGPTYAMAGMAVFFLFFTVQFGVASLIEERVFGTWDRLLSTGVRRGVVIAAKALVSFVLGITSMAVLMIGASVGLGADWGNVGAVALLVIFGVLCATAVMSLVAAFSKTVEGAGNIQGIIAVVLGMLGGTFVPIASDGGWISNLSLLTPHAWFLRGLNDLSGGGSIGLIAPSLAAMGVFIVVVGGLAIWAFNRGETA